MIHAFVRHGLEALEAHHSTLWRDRVLAIGGSLEPRCGEARDMLQRYRRDAQQIDVVYLDPMFPAAKRKSALPKRRMQWLRQYLDKRAPCGSGEGLDKEVQELIEMAQTVARKVPGPLSLLLLLIRCRWSHS